MNPITDLRTLRRSYGLTQQDLSALAGVRYATLSEAENGLRLPRKHTRKRIEMILGSRIDWMRTYSNDKEHLVYALGQFLNPAEPGMNERVRIARQTLKAIESLNTTP